MNIYNMNLIISILNLLFIFEGTILYNYLKNNIDEKKFNIIIKSSFSIAICSSIYSYWTGSHIFIYVFGLVMLNSLIILLIKKEWKRAAYFSIRNAIYVFILYEIYITKYL
ncbi:heme lyase [Clostridium perfringens]|nr:heme lyase [Clostridium perfringens]